LSRPGSLSALDQQPFLFGVQVSSGGENDVEKPLDLQSVAVAGIGLQLAFGDDAVDEFERRADLRIEHIQSSLLIEIVCRQMA
jgi:hypothetical protein